VVVLRDGRYHFAGRRDGVVNVGGQKVHPEEVEAVINQHPDVEMSLVRSRANPITGAIVVAEIVRKGPGLGQSRALEEDVRAFCRSRLEPHKVPASIRLVASLDIAPTGKLVRLGA
jgi:acyl-coenzyme A synthetase/AMP-(fatty) acid ligase